MEKRIKAYIRYMDERIDAWKNGEADREEKTGIGLSEIKKEHLTQISFFQHERLIHLIVTVTFALLEMLAILFTLLSPNPATFALVIAVLILLVPYIRHYYILENLVQKMYEQYDRINELSGNSQLKG